MNVLLRCGRRGVPIIEVPITTVYPDKQNSSSHFNGLRDSIRIYIRIFRFASASLISFCSDYLLFLLLTAIFPAGALFVIVSNILARIGSASLNYTLNARAVFRDSAPASSTLPKYAALAAAILLANSLLLTAFTLAGIPAAAAKLLCELILFVLSYFVQSRFIFIRPEAGKGGDADAAHAGIHRTAA